MHWYIPTENETVNVGGTFFVNACLGEGNRHTEDPKKITCRACKALFEYPRTPGQTAAKLVQHIIDEQEEGRKSDFFVEVSCNGCDYDLDVFGWYESEELHVLVAKMIHFLSHVAYDHAYGTEVRVTRETTPMSVYQLNLGMGKPAQTTHEEKWRERMGLVSA